MRRNLETSNMGLFSELALGIYMGEILFGNIPHTSGAAGATCGGSGMDKHILAGIVTIYCTIQRTVFGLLFLSLGVRLAV